MTCALRALTLCDGTRLEDSERGLRECLCEERDRMMRIGAGPGYPRAVAELEGLIERTLAEPILVVPIDQG